MAQDQEHNEKVYFKYQRMRYLKIGAFVFVVILLILTVLAAMGRREVINCPTLGTQLEAMIYVDLHPSYLNRLDGDHNGMPCQDLPLW